MKQYHDLLRHILDNGKTKGDRTGTGTISVFGYQNRYRLSEGFPALTTKKLHMKSVIHELLWFIRGDTNISYLKENGVTIWDEWASPAGALGPVYGHQWKYFLGPYVRKDGAVISYQKIISKDGGDEIEELYGLNQLQDVIDRIRKKPDDRRLIVSAWNPIEVQDQGLPACHSFFQFYVRDGELSCHMYQRSADAFLGVPFNIASYALLVHMVAHITNLKPGDFIHSFGDLHIYLNHLEQVQEQLSREPRPLPELLIKERGQVDVEDFVYEDFGLLNYNPHPAIKAPVAI